MSRPDTPTYKTQNWPTYNEALKRRGALTIWFDTEMTWEAKPTGKRGRQPVYSGEEDQKTVRGTVFPTNAVQTCLTMKVLFGMVDIVAPLVRATMSTRQTTGFVQSLLQRIGLDWAVPDFSTLSRRQKTLKVSDGVDAPRRHLERVLAITIQDSQRD